MITDLSEDSRMTKPNRRELVRVEIVDKLRQLLVLEWIDRTLE